MNEFECPVCGIEWYKGDLDHLNTEGCPGCSHKFDLESYLHEDEPLWHDWREKCYERMKRQYENERDAVALLQFKHEIGL